MSKSIEPPLVITSKEHGINVIQQVVDGLQTARRKTKNKPTVGMMYLRFKNEEEVDDWMGKFEFVVQTFWKEKLGVQEPLHIQAICRDNDRGLADVLFAPDAETLRLLIKQRYPDMNI